MLVLRSWAGPAPKGRRPHPEALAYVPSKMAFRLGSRDEVIQSLPGKVNANPNALLSSSRSGRCWRRKLPPRRLSLPQATGLDHVPKVGFPV